MNTIRACPWQEPSRGPKKSPGGHCQDPWLEKKPAPSSHLSSISSFHFCSMF
jgi:hypothetical protein